MQAISNVATQDGYVDALTLGPDPVATQLIYVVANAAVYARFASQRTDLTAQPFGPEVLITPSTNTVQRVAGVQFRSAVAGVPARVVAQLVDPDDPQFGGGVPFASTLAASGGLTPGVASVQVEKDGALVGQEAALNIIGTRWVVADNGALGRIDITPTPDVSATQISIAGVANVPYPTGLGNSAVAFVHLTAPGGPFTLRSWGAPPGGVGARLLIRNATSGDISFTHLDGAATLIPFFFDTNGTFILSPGQRVEFVFNDAANVWVQAGYLNSPAAYKFQAGMSNFANGSTAVTFAQPFTFCQAITITSEVGVGAARPITIGARATTGFTMVNGTGGVEPISWMAMGT